MPQNSRVGEIATAIRSADDARWLLGQSLVMLAAAYRLTDTHGGAPEEANREYLDGIRLRAESDYAGLPAGAVELDARTARQIAFDVASIETASGQTLDILGKSTAIEDLATGIKDAAVDIVEGAVTAVGSVIPWWVWPVAIVAAVVILKSKVKS